MNMEWTYDREKDSDVTTAPSGERVWVYENRDKRWDVTADWGDTYRGAPTRTDALEIAERLIAQHA